MQTPILIELPFDLCLPNDVELFYDLQLCRRLYLINWRLLDLEEHKLP